MRGGLSTLSDDETCGFGRAAISFGRSEECKSGMRGSLHCGGRCAAFGRDDDLLSLGARERAKAKCGGTANGWWWLVGQRGRRGRGCGEGCGGDRFVPDRGRERLA